MESFNVNELTTIEVTVSGRVMICLMFDKKTMWVVLTLGKYVMIFFQRVRNTPGFVLRMSIAVRQF